MRIIDSYFARLAIRYAQRKPAPSRIVRTGASAKSVDCYVVYMSTQSSDSDEYLIDGVIKEGIKARTFEGQNFAAECVILNSTLVNFNFSATHFYGHNEFVYDSPIIFLVKEISNIPFFVCLTDYINQELFNLKTPVRNDRINILRKYIELRRQHAIENGAHLGRDGPNTGSVEIVHAIYGNRIFGHPDFDRISVDTQLTIESLVSSGDLEQREHRYRATGQSLVTISDFEDSNRKHRDQVRQSNVLSVLTAILAVIAAIQVYVTWIVSK